MLKQTIKEDLKIALKTGKTLKVSVLRMALASLQNKEKEKRYKLVKEKPDLTEQDLEEKSQLADQEVLEALFSEVKKRKDSIEEFKKGQRTDLVEKEEQEIEVLEKYLPDQLSEEEIKKAAQEAIKQLGAKEPKDMGRVMNQLMTTLKTRADGGLASKVVKELLLQKD